MKKYVTSLSFFQYFESLIHHYLLLKNNICANKIFSIKGYLHTIETRTIYLVNHNISCLFLFNFNELIKISLYKKWPTFFLTL